MPITRDERCVYSKEICTFYTRPLQFSAIQKRFESAQLAAAKHPHRWNALYELDVTSKTPAQGFLRSFSKCHAEILIVEIEMLLLHGLGNLRQAEVLASPKAIGHLGRD